MTGIHPVQSFKALSTPKKVAAVAGTIAGVALIATGAAYGKGRYDAKALLAEGETLGKGKTLEFIKNGYSAAYKAVCSFLSGLKDKVSNLGKKGDAGEKAANEVIEEAAEAVSEVVEKA